MPRRTPSSSGGARGATGGGDGDVLDEVRERLDDDLDTPGAFAAIDDAAAAGLGDGVGRGSGPARRRALTGPSSLSTSPRTPERAIPGDVADQRVSRSHPTRSPPTARRGRSPHFHGSGLWRQVARTARPGPKWSPVPGRSSALRLVGIVTVHTLFMCLRQRQHAGCVPWPSDGHEQRSRRRATARPPRARSAGPPGVGHPDRGLRPPADRRPGDPVPEPHLVPRLGVPDAERPAQHQLRRQGRVHGLVEDEVPLPGDGHDPDRPHRRLQVAGGALGRRSGAAPRRAVRHLPRGHTQPRRRAAPGPHRRGPAGPRGRRARSSRSASRAPTHPAARRQGAEAVRVVLDHDRSADRTGPLRRHAPNAIGRCGR